MTPSGNENPGAGEGGGVRADGDMPTLTVAMAGAGMVSAFHLQAWQRIPGTRVVAIADPDRSRARSRALEFGIEQVFDDAVTMLERVRPDAVDIVSPVASHGTTCRFAASLGIHVCCQKPLGESLVEARDIVASVGSRVRFMVHENWRHRPPYRQVRDWLDQDRVGQPAWVRLRMASSGLLPDRLGTRPALVRQPFFADMERFLVFEVLVHHLDVLRWLVGPVRVHAARIARATGATRGEDSAFVLLEGASGLPVLLEGSFAEPGAPTLPSDHLDIVGARGSISLHGNMLTLSAERSERLRFDESMAVDAYAGAIAAFVAGLRTGEPFPTEARDNLAVLELVEAVYDAAARA